MSTTQEVLEHHLQCFGAGDIDGILSDYTDESIVVSPMGTIDNMAGLRELFTGFFAEFGQEGVVFNMGDTFIADHVAMITWSADTPNNAYEFVTDTFIVQGGKIVRQTFIGQIVPKG